MKTYNEIRNNKIIKVNTYEDLNEIRGNDAAADEFKNICKQVIAKDKNSGDLKAAVFHFNTGILVIWDSHYGPTLYTRDETNEIFDLIDYNSWNV